MGTLFKRFSVTRILRILIGGYFLFAAVGEKSWAMGIIGSILLLQGVLNMGCGFGTDSCAPNIPTKNDSGFDASKAFRKLDY